MTEVQIKPKKVSTRASKKPKQAAVEAQIASREDLQPPRVHAMASPSADPRPEGRPTASLDADGVALLLERHYSQVPAQPTTNDLAARLRAHAARLKAQMSEPSALADDLIVAAEQIEWFRARKR